MSPAHETATQLDRAIEGLLRPQPTGEIGLEGGLTATARLLRDALPRLHPRFGFEELLAERLRAAARPGGPVAGAAAFPVADPIPLRALAAPAPGPGEGPPEPGCAVESDLRRRRGRMAGGAIASGVSLALPLAGAAYVVWRRSRSSGGIL